MTKKRRTMIFQMWEPFRETKIRENQFLLEQINKKLLPQFDSINEDANAAEQEWLEIRSRNFNPDTDDPGSVYEEACDHGVSIYTSLTEMHEQTRLSLMASIYHHWDKTIRTWLVDEIRRWHCGENVPKQIWTANLDDLIDLLDSIGLAEKGAEYIKTISKYRHVVNVYKHGQGNAFNTLKDQHPEFLRHHSSSIPDSLFSYTDHTHLKIEDKDITSLSEAISEFWKLIPAEVYDADEIEAPDWFMKALKKDSAQS